MYIFRENGKVGMTKGGDKKHQKDIQHIGHSMWFKHVLPGRCGVYVVYYGLQASGYQAHGLRMVVCGTPQNVVHVVPYPVYFGTTMYFHVLFLDTCTTVDV